MSSKPFGGSSLRFTTLKMLVEEKRPSKFVVDDQEQLKLLSNKNEFTLEQSFSQVYWEVPVKELYSDQVYSATFTSYF